MHIVFSAVFSWGRGQDGRIAHVARSCKIPTCGRLWGRLARCCATLQHNANIGQRPHRVVVHLRRSGRGRYNRTTLLLYAADCVFKQRMGGWAQQYEGIEKAFVISGRRGRIGQINSSNEYCRTVPMGPHGYLWSQRNGSSGPKDADRNRRKVVPKHTVNGLSLNGLSFAILPVVFRNAASICQVGSIPLDN